MSGRHLALLLMGVVLGNCMHSYLCLFTEHGYTRCGEIKVDYDK